MPSAPTTDPWGWIVWGREVVHLRLDTAAGPPSWKPLPVLFTTPLALLGGAAPAAWLVVARAGGLLALVLAYRLGTRLAGRVAGAIAVLALLLSAQWLRQFAHGYSEGLAVALALWAVESHLDGRCGRALALGALVALSRPEAWPFVLVYGVLVRPRAWPLPIAAPPLLWILPDWWGSGDPLHASAVAHVNLLDAGAHPGVTVLRGTWAILPALVWLCASAAVLPVVARRVPAARVLAAGAAVWIAGLALATELGYPGTARFLTVPAGIACVLAGVGAVRVVEACPRPGWRAALALVLAAAALPALLGRVEHVPRSGRQSVVRARFERDLRASVSRAGGRARVLRLGRPVLPSRLWWTAGALAWDLRVPLERIGKIRESDLAAERRLRGGAVVFAPLAGTPPDDPSWQPAHPDARVLARAGIWRVMIAGRRAGPRARAAQPVAVAKDSSITGRASSGPEMSSTRSPSWRPSSKSRNAQHADSAATSSRVRRSTPGASRRRTRTPAAVGVRSSSPSRVSASISARRAARPSADRVQALGRSGMSGSS